MIHFAFIILAITLDIILFLDLSFRVLYVFPSVISSLYILVTLIPSLSALTRRLHDVGYSGLFMLVPSLFLLSLFLIFSGQWYIRTQWYIRYNFYFILIILFILSSIWLITIAKKDSTPGSNQYGPNPKGIQA